MDPGQIRSDYTCSESTLLLGGEGTWYKYNGDCQKAQSYSAGGEYFGKERGANRQRKRTGNNLGIEFYNFMDVGAADKAAIQLVEVQPYQLLVSDT